MNDYVPGRLLVAGFPHTDDAPWLVELRQVLAELGLAFRLTPSSERRIKSLRSTRGRARDLLDGIWVSTVVLTPSESQDKPLPPVWWVLERVRQLRPTLVDRLSLVEARRPATTGAHPLAGFGFGVPA
jgi:hypothetical protein